MLENLLAFSSKEELEKYSCGNNPDIFQKIHKLIDAEKIQKNTVNIVDKVFSVIESIYLDTGIRNIFKKLYIEENDPFLMKLDKILIFNAIVAAYVNCLLMNALFSSKKEKDSTNTETGNNYFQSIYHCLNWLTTVTNNRELVLASEFLGYAQDTEDGSCILDKRIEQLKKEIYNCAVYEKQKTIGASRTAFCRANNSFSEFYSSFHEIGKQVDVKEGEHIASYYICELLFHNQALSTLQINASKVKSMSKEERGKCLSDLTCVFLRQCFIPIVFGTEKLKYDLIKNDDYVLDMRCCFAKLVKKIIWSLYLVYDGKFEMMMGALNSIWGKSIFNEVRENYSFELYMPKRTKATFNFLYSVDYPTRLKFFYAITDIYTDACYPNFKNDKCCICPINGLEDTIFTYRSIEDEIGVELKRTKL